MIEDNLTETIAVALYQNERDNAPRAGRVTWEMLASDLLQHERTSCGEGFEPCPGKSCKHKCGQAWAPVELTGDGSRNAKNVRTVSAFVADLDSCDGATMARVAKAIDGHAYVVHSTHSPNSYRLVMRLSRPVRAHEWPVLWPNVVGAFGLPADPACKDTARLYFFPSAPTGSPVVAEQGFGLPLDVESFLKAPERASRPEKSPAITGAAGATTPPASLPVAVAGLSSTALDMEAVRRAVKALRKGGSRELGTKLLNHEAYAAPGSRDAVTNQVASLVAHLLDTPMSADNAVAFMSPSIERMDCEPEGVEYWKAKARYSFERSARRRVESEAQQRKDREALASVLPREPKGEPVADGEEDPEAWRRLLIISKDSEGNATGAKPVEANMELILQYDPRWAGTLRWNEVLKVVDVVGGPLEDVPANDVEFATAVWLQRSEYKCAVQSRNVGPALLRVARMAPYDPLRAYLRGLAWDRTERLHSYFTTILGASPTRINQIIGRKWALSCVARALEPGCKVDNVLILQGAYGSKKTSFVEVMAGEFYSNGKIDFASKDSRMLAARYWLVELAEMSGYRRADKEAVKDWLSTRIDSYRPPYGRVVEDFPRRCVYVGTANDDDFLPEPNRREWPLRVGDIDIAKLKAERDQIFAEAVHLYDAAAECPHCPSWPGFRCPEHSWWLEGEDAAAMREVAAEFGQPDPTQDMLVDWWVRQPVEKRPGEFSVHECAMEALAMTRDRVNAAVMRDVGRALKAMGFWKRRGLRAGKLAWFYVPSRELAAMNFEQMKAKLAAVQNIG